MGNIPFLSENTNPKWNNLPSSEQKSLGKDCRDLDELLKLVRSYGGPGEEDEEEQHEKQEKKHKEKKMDEKQEKYIPSAPDDLSPPIQKKSTVSPLSSQKIYPESKFASSSPSQSKPKPTGKALVSLR